MVIGSSAFLECSSLTSIVISNHIIGIEESAFYECDQLCYIYYKGTEREPALNSDRTVYDSILLLLCGKSKKMN